FVVVFEGRNEIAGPASGEVIDGPPLCVAAVTPMKIEMRVGAHESRFALQALVVEVFALESLRPVRSRPQFGVAHDFVKGWNIDDRQDFHVAAGKIADALKKADVIKRLSQ